MLMTLMLIAYLLIVSMLTITVLIISVLIASTLIIGMLRARKPGKMLLVRIFSNRFRFPAAPAGNLPA